MFTESLYASAFRTTRFHKQKHHRLIGQKKFPDNKKKKPPKQIVYNPGIALDVLRQQQQKHNYKASFYTAER